MPDDLSWFWDALVSCHGDLQELLELIPRRVVEIVGEGCVLTVVGADGETLDPVAVYHEDHEVMAFMRDVVHAAPYRIGTGIAGIVAADRKPVMLSDLTPEHAASAIAVSAQPFIDRYAIHALMIVPLVAYGELVGTLAAIRTQSKAPYTDEDLTVLQALGERVALPLADSGAEVRPLTASDLRAIFEHSLDGVLFTSRDGHVLAANPAACESLQRSEAEICRLGVFPAHDRRVQDAMTQRAISGRVRAELPAWRGDGTTFTADVSSTIFTTDDGQLRACIFFRDISVQVAWREQLEAQSRQLVRLAEQDVLTGLLNRRGLDQSAGRTLAFADRDQAPVQLVFCDIDNLKTINDQFGHSAGDEVIVRLGAAIKRTLRAVDLGVRISGDEFLLMLFATTRTDAQLVVERLVVAFDESPEGVYATFSAGIAEREPGSTIPLDRLLDAADKEMYKQKVIRRLEHQIDLR